MFYSGKPSLIQAFKPVRQNVQVHAALVSQVREGIVS